MKDRIIISNKNHSHHVYSHYEVDLRQRKCEIITLEAVKHDSCLRMEGPRGTARSLRTLAAFIVTVVSVRSESRVHYRENIIALFDNPDQYRARRAAECFWYPSLFLLNTEPTCAAISEIYRTTVRPLCMDAAK